MNEQSFRARVKDEGYGEPVLLEWDAGLLNESHSHDFDATILVIEGEITVTCADRTSTCQTGDSDALAAGTPHTEEVGPEGVKFLVARR